MKKFNFKEFFTNDISYSNKVIHNNEYASNTHFLIKKTELKNNQLEFVNGFPEADVSYNNHFSQIVSSQLKINTEQEFKPERIHIGCDNNIVIMGEVGIKESYLSFIESLKCKLFVMKSDKKWSPLSIYNSNHEFVGVVLPIKLNMVQVNESIDYIVYLDNLKLEQEAKELAKQNLKKCLYIKDNKAVIRNKELISIAELINDESYKNLYIEKTTKQDAGVYIDLDIVHVYIRSITGDATHEDIKYYLNNATNYTLEKALENIYNRKNNNQFINVVDIKLVELSGASEQEVQGLIDYRQEWYDRKAKEEQEKKLKQEQEDKEYADSKNKIVDELISQAEQAIINNQKVNNKEITVYKSRFERNDTSLILHMMKLYEIKVPLKTQGWINQALASIFYDEGDCKISYSYYKSSANSNVFRKYLNEFVNKVHCKYSIGVESLVK